MKRILLITTLMILLCSQAWATNYYVRDDGDDGNTGLSDAQAWLTIAKVNGFSFTDGDDVYFKCDDTWTGTQLVIDWDGVNAGNHTIIGAYHGAGTIGVSGSKPIIDGTGSGIGEQDGLVRYYETTTAAVDGYITFQDLNVVDSPGIGIKVGRNSVYAGGYLSADYITIDNCTITDSQEQGILAARGNHITITDNILTTCNMDNNGAALETTAMAHAGIGDYFVVRGNTIARTGNEGIGNYKWARYALIENNVLYNCANGPSIYIAAVIDATIRNNMVYSSNVAYKSDAGIQLDDETEQATYCVNGGHKIYGNLIAYQDYGIKITNNMQKNVDPTCTTDNNHIYNNTIVDCGTNIFIRYDLGDAWTGNYFYNNISYQTNYPTSGDHYNSGVNNAANGFTFSHNNFSDSASGNIATNYVLGAPGISKTSGWDSLVAGDVTTDDFALIQGSRCIDAGTYLTEVNEP